MLQPIVNSIGIGWAYTVLGVINFICCGGYLLIRQRGMRWRVVRLKKGGKGLVDGVVDEGVQRMDSIDDENHGEESCRGKRVSDASELFQSLAH